MKTCRMTVFDNEQVRITGMDDRSVCPMCGGTLEDKAVQLDFRYKGRLVVVEEVPAQVCKDCGERLISAATSQEIDLLLD